MGIIFSKTTPQEEKGHFRNGYLHCGNVSIPPCDAEAGITVAHRFCFILITRGKACLCGNGPKRPLLKNDLLLLTPGMKARIQHAGRGASLSFVSIAPHYFDSLPDGHPLYQQLPLANDRQQPPVVHLEPEESDYLKKTHDLFAGRLAGFSTHREGLIRHLCSFYLLQIADLLFRNNADTATCISHSDTLYRRFKKLLVENYRQQHGIAFYANRLHVSTTYLSRIVKQTTGRTIRSHLAELLSADARHLLECTDWEIKEIAGHLGFSAPSVFSKFFHGHTGTAPSAFRRGKEA